MKNIKKCAECGYCRREKGTYSTRYGFYCGHPDRGYIEDYFLRKQVKKIPGFIGFGKPFSGTPALKTSPAWCPEKKEVKLQMGSKAEDYKKNVGNLP